MSFPWRRSALLAFVLASAFGQRSDLTPDQRADMLIRKMMLDEKIQLVHGAGFPGLGPTDPSIVRSNGGGGFVPGIPRLGLPDLNMDDSAVGVGGGAGKAATQLFCLLHSRWRQAGI